MRIIQKLLYRHYARKNMHLLSKRQLDFLIQNMTDDYMFNLGMYQLADLEHPNSIMDKNLKDTLSQLQSNIANLLQDDDNIKRDNVLEFRK